MTLRVIELKRLDDEVTCSVQATEYGTGYVYVGTNDGDIYRYNVLTEVYTRLGNVGATPTSMVMYSGLLYVGLKGSQFVTVYPWY